MSDPEYPPGSPHLPDWAGTEQDTARTNRLIATLRDGSARVLAIGSVRQLPPEFLSAPERNALLAPYSAVDHAFLQRVSPEIVIAPVFGDDFDIIDLIQRLESSGYAGEVIGFASPMPNRKSVQSEIRDTCRAIRFTLVLLDAT